MKWLHSTSIGNQTFKTLSQTKKEKIQLTTGYFSDLLLHDHYAPLIILFRAVGFHR